MNDDVEPEFKFLKKYSIKKIIIFLKINTEKNIIFQRIQCCTLNNYFESILFLKKKNVHIMINVLVVVRHQLLWSYA